MLPYKYAYTHLGGDFVVNPSNQNLSHEHIHLSEKEDVLFQLTHDTGSYVPHHWHHDIELIYLLEGELEVTVLSEVYQLHAHDIILINSQMPHSTKCIRGNDAILLILPFHFIEKYYPLLPNVFFRLNNHPCPIYLLTALNDLKHLLQEMKTAYKSSNDAKRLKFNALLFTFLFQLIENFTEITRHVNTPLKNTHQEKIDLIFQYTLAHYNEPITLTTISTLVSFQPEYFCRFFKKYMGLTFNDYVQDIRLSYIYQDIITTELPINRILESHGFTNEKRFRQLFKQRFHSTPRDIRKGARPN